MLALVAACSSSRTVTDPAGGPDGGSDVPADCEEYDYYDEVELCGGACVRTAEDPLNCGACGVVCDENEPSCVQGVCTPPSCWEEEIVCHGACTDPTWDSANCGGCDVACGTVCVAGRCVSGDCDADCSGYERAICCEWRGEDTCVGPDFDPENCGGCGVACADPHFCIDGVCRCPVDQCGATCVDTASDPLNCGACGVACGPGAPACRAGVCVPCASFDLEECDGTCVDTRFAHEDCGACDAACSATAACVRGSCVPGVATCDPPCDAAAGRVCCSDGCVDLLGDGYHCGSCEGSCPVPEWGCVFAECREDPRGE